MVHHRGIAVPPLHFFGGKEFPFFQAEDARYEITVTAMTSAPEGLIAAVRVDAPHIRVFEFEPGKKPVPVPADAIQD